MSGGRGKAAAAAVDPDELEEITAFHAGLPNAALAEHEEGLLHTMKGSNVEQYIKVRNHVLTRWRADVTRYLSLEEAGKKIQAKYLPLVRIAWEFLSKHGFINFGVAPSLLNEPLGNRVGRKSVIIIGAGLAGASAARQLWKWGYNVVVLEGRNRPGGRVWTMRMEGDGHAGMADLGGAIITGIDGNPLAILARQLGLPLHNIRDKCPMYLENGDEAPLDLDEQALDIHNALLNIADKVRYQLSESVAGCISVGTALHTLWKEVPRIEEKKLLQEQLLAWHFANVEFANAACMNTLSLRNWDQDDEFETEGAHVFLPGGNLQLVEGLLKDVPVFYNSIVSEVNYGDEGVQVKTQEHEFHADAVLVTVPLGVLKKRTIKFSPELPRPKLDAIERLGFGALNKLVLLFPYAFWDSSIDLIAHVTPDPQDAGLFFLFYAYPNKLAGNGAVLAALVSGTSAINFEHRPIEGSVEAVMRVLRSIHDKRGVRVPDPLQAAGTRWASDPLSFGSYSSVAVGSAGADDYDALARPVRGKLYFAGEATIAKWPATMHGAYISGLREASNIRMASESSQKKRERQAAEGSEEEEEDAGPTHRRQQQQRRQRQQQRQQQQQQQQQEEDGVDGSDSEEEAGVAEREGQAVRNQPAAESQAVAQAMGRVARAMERAFKEIEPDAEFGGFSVLYGPQEGELKDLCLVEVDMGNVRSGPLRNVRMHTVLSRAQVSALRDLRGSDRARLTVLTRDFGVKLVGRWGVDAQCTRLLVAILRKHNVPWGAEVEALASAQEQQAADDSNDEQKEEGAEEAPEGEKQPDDATAVDTSAALGHGQVHDGPHVWAHIPGL